MVGLQQPFSSSNSSNIKVLHVDDELGFLNLTKIMVESKSSDISVSSLLDPSQVLNLLSDQHFDVVLSDYSMTPLTGIELLKLTRQHTPDLPFIIFTGRGREEVAIEALNLGADRYVKKGSDPDGMFEELVHAIRSVVEARRTVEALKQSEDTNKAILEALPDLVFEVSEKGRFLFYHIGRQEDMYVQPTQFMGRTIPEIFPHDLATKLMEMLHQAFASGTTATVEYELEMAGQIGTYEARGAITNRGTAVIIVRNISEQKEMERSLRHEREQFSRMVENAPMAVVITDADQVLYVNPPFIELFGYTLTDIPTPDDWLRLAYPNEVTRNAVRQNWVEQWKNSKEGVMRSYEARITTKEGQSRLVKFRGVDIGEDRKMVLLHDVTEIREVEVELIAKQAQLERLLGNIPGMIFRCLNNQNWTMDYVSQGSREVTGYSPEELVQNTLVTYGSLIHPNDLLGAWEERQQQLRGKKTFHLSYRIKAKEGTTKWVDERGSGVYNEEGQVVCVEGIITTKESPETKKSQGTPIFSPLP